MVSRNAVPLSLYPAGMATQHLADQWIAGRRPPAGRRRDQQRDRLAHRAKRALSGPVDFQLAAAARAYGLDGKALVPSQLCELRLPAHAEAAGSSRTIRPHREHAVVCVSQAATAASYQGLAAVASRSGPVVSILDFLRAVGTVLFECRPV